MRKKILYILLSFFLIVIMLLNYIAYNHAYKFTHYANIKEGKLKVSDTSHISWTKKLSYIFQGVDVPRPKNHIKPFFDYEKEKIKTKDGSIEVWIGVRENARGTVLLFHGYANRKSSLISRAEEFYYMGYNVVLIDFLGSGGSDGNTCSIGYKEAEQVKACYDYVCAKGEKNIYLFGISMGAVAIMKYVKDDHPDVKGIILECPFGYFKTTVNNRFKNFGVPTFPLADLLMVWGSYHMDYWTYNHNPADYAKEINCPVLLLHGEKDHAVSKKEIDDIFENLDGKKILKTFENTGHDIFTANNKYIWIVAIKNFLLETGTISQTELGSMYGKLGFE